MRPLPENLIERTDTCWNWLGRVDRNGYGRIGDHMAHRRAFIQAGGTIPDGLEIDHLCWNRGCVNPAHLEAVTRAENMRRRYADYNECVNGHEYTVENTYIRTTGHRDCRICKRTRSTAWARAKREAARMSDAA